MRRPGRTRRPRVPLRLIGRLLPRTVAGRTILGDLLEEYHLRSPGVRRRIWVRAAAVRLILTYTPSKLADLARDGGPGGLRADVRAGMRSLRRAPGAVAIIVATLAIGIGGTTAIMSALYGSLMKPLPFPDADRVVVVGDRSVSMAADRVVGNIALPNVHDLAAMSNTLERLAAYRDRAMSVSGAGEAGVWRTQEVDAGFFEVLGVSMRIGRPIAAADQQPGTVAVAVLGEAVWRDRFGADEEVLGRSLLVDGVSRTIIGVAGTATQIGNPQLWLPLADDWLAARNRRQVYAVARLAPGATVHAVREELPAIFEDLVARYPEIGASRSVGVVPMESWLIGERGRQLLLRLAGAVGLVLIIACINAAHLMVIRTERRRVELAVLAALGATRLRLIRMLAVESLAMSMAAGAAGLVFAAWTVPVLVARYGATLPRAWEIGIDPVVIAAAVAVSTTCGLAVIALPAARLPGRRPGEALAGAARGSAQVGRSQRVLIAGQAALALTLLVTAGLLINSVWRLAHRDLGIDTASGAVFGLNLAGRSAGTEPPEVFTRRLLERIAGLPGVSAAAAASRRPLVGGTNGGFELPGLPGAAADALLEIRAVTPSYFEVLGIPVISGRGLTAADRTTGVVVNQAFERAYFPDRGALGERIRPTGQDRVFRIVGVVGDVMEFGPGAEARPTGYWPYGGGPYGAAQALTVVVRVESGKPLTAIGPVRDVVRALDPGLAVDDPMTLDALALAVAGRGRLAVRALLVLAGVLAIGLTLTGIYGVVSHAAGRRTREIGIRRALGASGGQVVGLLMREGLRAAVPGLLVGAALSMAAGRLVSGYLYDVAPTDLMTLLSACFILSAAVVMACWVPARRATRIEAVDALRQG